MSLMTLLDFIFRLKNEIICSSNKREYQSITPYYSLITLSYCQPYHSYIKIDLTLIPSCSDEAKLDVSFVYSLSISLVIPH